MRCDCCEATIPSDSLRRICPPCADSLRIAVNRAHMVCSLHARQMGWGEWDNQPVRTA